MINRLRNTLGYLRWVLLTGTMVAVGLATMASLPTTPTQVYGWAHPVATATATDTPGNWSTYRWADTYTCARVETGAPADDPCVYDPDPEGNPVPVEPDSGITARQYLPDGTDVRVRVAPVANWTTPPPDGTVYEDDPSWDCRTMGNGVCGPDNTNGVDAGCYQRRGAGAGTLIARWDETMAAQVLTEYRPSMCGPRTPRDRAMADRLNGGVGQLCAGVRPSGMTCWYADEPRPKSADGPAYIP